MRQKKRNPEETQKNRLYSCCWKRPSRSQHQLPKHGSVADAGSSKPAAPKRESAGRILWCGSIRSEGEGRWQHRPSGLPARAH